MFFFFPLNDSQIPSFEQMMRPILAALVELGGTAKRKDLDEQTIEIMNLSEEVVNYPHKGSGTTTEVLYRMAWARTYLKKVGLIKNISRGVWSLTDAFSGDINSIDPAVIARAVNRENREKASYSNFLSGIESSLAFENLVLGILAERTKKQTKEMQTPSYQQLDSGIDAILPEGVDDIEGAVFCAIQYLNPRSQNLQKTLVDAVEKMDVWPADGTILLVVNDNLPQREKEAVYSEIAPKLQKKIVL